MTLLHAQSAGRLNVCHAGSLTAAFTPIEDEFRRLHPLVTLTDTSGGSVDLARRAAGGSLPCDVFAPADHLLVERLMKPARLADYTIVFARGRMVLAYTASDPKAQGLKVSGTFTLPSSVPDVAPGWYEALTAPGVRIAGAHPFLDPGGYRAHLIFELAQRHYGVPGLYNALLQHYQVNVADGRSPAAAIGKDYDFQIIYEHSAAAAAARNPDYRYARLPPEIDLSSPDPAQYAGASVTIPGLGTMNAPASVTIEASRVAWGVTILKTSRNKENATRFLALILGPTGAAAFTANGPAPLTPGRVSRADLSLVPSSLRALVAAE